MRVNKALRPGFEEGADLELAEMQGKTAHPIGDMHLHRPQDFRTMGLALQGRKLELDPSCSHVCGCALKRTLCLTLMR